MICMYLGNSPVYHVTMGSLPYSTDFLSTSTASLQQTSVESPLKVRFDMLGTGDIKTDFSYTLGQD